MTKPTREEVKELQACLEEYKHNAPWREYTLNLCEAYLAQEEELSQTNNTLRLLMKLDKEQLEAITSLKDENQALKTKGEQLCCRVGVLEMENQKLRAGSLRLEA